MWIRILPTSPIEGSWMCSHPAPSVSSALWEGAQQLSSSGRETELDVQSIFPPKNLLAHLHFEDATGVGGFGGGLTTEPEDMGQEP